MILSHPSLLSSHLSIYSCKVCLFYFFRLSNFRIVFHNVFLHILLSSICCCYSICCTCSRNYTRFSKSYFCLTY
uniref:Uncharacterized protein n=1 Tax=uncultured marine virus TaxID=186617 RepID=A0A0F7L463_9VIRU|nr:hypothetical protein [uncultured marine virus]